MPFEFRPTSTSSVINFDTTEPHLTAVEEIDKEYDLWLCSEGLIDLEAAPTLHYPCLASAFLDYCATGEGRTIGLLVTSANCATDLRNAVEQAWGDYFCRGVLVRPWKGVPSRYAMLNGNPVDIVVSSDAWPCYVKFVTTLHFNAS